MASALLPLYLLVSLLSCHVVSAQHVGVTWRRTDGALEEFAILETFRHGIPDKTRTDLARGHNVALICLPNPESIYKFILCKDDYITKVEFDDPRPTLSDGVYGYDLVYSPDQIQKTVGGFSS